MSEMSVETLEEMAEEIRMSGGDWKFEELIRLARLGLEMKKLLDSENGKANLGIHKQGSMKEIHSTPCEKCPSEWYPPDPEAHDLLTMVTNGEIREEDFLFVCAWRPNKICRGLWNRLQEYKANQS